MNRQASDSRDRETHQTLSAELPGPRVSLRGKVGNRLLPVYGRTVTPNDSHFSIAEVPRSRVQVAVAAAGAYARRQGAKYNESVPGCGAPEVGLLGASASQPYWANYAIALAMSIMPGVAAAVDVFRRSY